MARTRGKEKYSGLKGAAYSIFFACMVYLAFSIYTRESRCIGIPITIKANDRLVNNSNMPKFVDVMIKGDRDLIYGIDADKISAKVDFSSLDMEGIYSLPVLIEYDLGLLNAAKVEIYAVKPRIRVSMVKRPETTEL